MSLLLTLVSCVIAFCKAEFSDEEPPYGNIMIWSSLDGFPSYVETNGNLNDLMCFIETSFFGFCQSNIASDMGLTNRIKTDLIIGFYIDQLYNHDQLFDIKTNYGVTNYNFIEIFGIDIESGSRFYHKLNQLVKQSRYKIYPTSYEEFQNDFRDKTRAVFFEIDTIENAITTSEKITQYLEKHGQDRKTIYVVAPSKAELDTYSMTSRSLLASNSSCGSYCLSYQCNSSSSTNSTNESCVDQYELFGFGLTIFIFLPFLCLGCCFMNMIETPLRFPSRVLPVRKEY